MILSAVRGGKGCRPWEVLGDRRFLQSRKNLRILGPRPDSRLAPQAAEPATRSVQRGARSHVSTPFPTLLPTDRKHRQRPTRVLMYRCLAMGGVGVSSIVFIFGKDTGTVSRRQYVIAETLTQILTAKTNSVKVKENQ